MSSAPPLVVAEKAIAKVEPRFNQIAQPMGNIVRFQEEAEFAMQILRRSPYLARSEPQSIQDAVVNLASVGLSLNPAMQHAALIPRYDSKTKKVYCHFDPMYRGLLKLATDGGLVTGVQAEAVYEEEVRDGNFKITMGTEPSVMHNPDPFKKQSELGEIVGCYCIAYIKNNPKPHVKWMPIDDILNAREKSESWKAWKQKKQGNGGPWETDFQEMCVKTVIKRAQKQWPKGDGRLERAVHLSNIAESYVEPDPQDIQGEAVEVISQEQAVELRKMCKDIKMRVHRVYERFDIPKMEKLPAAKYKECKSNLLKATANYVLKNADKGQNVYAEDYGMKFEELEEAAARWKSKATLLTSRKNQ